MIMSHLDSGTVLRLLEKEIALKISNFVATAVKLLVDARAIFCKGAEDVHFRTGL